MSARQARTTVKPRISKAQRQQRIVAELRANPTVRISSLAEEFNVSTETVRRDIDALSAQGLVSRTYGGAAAPTMGWEPTLDTRLDTMVAERQRIAREAVKLIQPGDVVMLDSGATTAHVARRLAVEAPKVTVITNGIDIATAFAQTPGVRVILCPGDYVPGEHGVYGAATTEFLGRFRASHAMTSTGGLTEEGAVDVDSRACWVKRQMLARADMHVLLCDHGKFDTPLLERVCPLAELDVLVTDRKPPGPLARALKQAGVRIRVA